MERVVAYVDGYNLYHGLRAKNWKRFYWLNIQALAVQLLKPHQTLVFTKYFTTIIKQPEDKRKRQAVFLEPRWVDVVVASLLGCIGAAGF